MSEIAKLKGDIARERFGSLIKFLDDPEITDIDYNGKDIWIRDVYNQRTRVKPEEIPDITPQWIDTFTQRIADVVSKSFNKQHNVLEAETPSLRITCVHESSATSGKAVCIRKTSNSARITYSSALGTTDDDGNFIPGYASPEVLNLLINCMIAKMNFVICGEPGVGKTEFAKFLCQYIPNHEKVITIEDNPEWHYKTLKPQADGIELRTSEGFDYTKALKTCMRLNPSRVMLSEVRSVEAVHLIECWTAGVKGATTLHTDDVKKIPDRILNMMPAEDKERLENNIYECLDVGLLLRAKIAPGTSKKYRYLDQVCFFERKEVTVGEKDENGNEIYSKKERKNFCIPIVSGGEMVSTDIPESKLQTLRYAGISKPFSLTKPKKKSTTKPKNEEKTTAKPAEEKSNDSNETTIKEDIIVNESDTQTLENNVNNPLENKEEKAIE